MDLKKYVKINNLSYREMAARLNNIQMRKKLNLPTTPISFSQIAKWARGDHKPSLQSMKILQAMTHGKVTMKDFLID